MQVKTTYGENGMFLEIAKNSAQNNFIRVVLWHLPLQTFSFLSQNTSWQFQILNT